MIESPQFRNPLIDLSDRKRDGMMIGYWQRWFNKLYEAIVQPMSVVTITVSQAIGKIGSLVLVDASAAPVVLTLPTAKDGYGIPLNVKKIDGGPNAVTIQPVNSELIDGAATLVINVQYNSKSFVSDGTAWWIIQ